MYLARLEKASMKADPLDSRVQGALHLGWVPWLGGGTALPLHVLPSAATRITDAVHAMAKVKTITLLCTQESNSYLP